jgi:hypothetical protein
LCRVCEFSSREWSNIIRSANTCNAYTNSNSNSNTNPYTNSCYPNADTWSTYRYTNTYTDARSTYGYSYTYCYTYSNTNPYTIFNYSISRWFYGTLCGWFY